MPPQSKVVITGAAGFIGMHLAVTMRRLGYEVVAIDNLQPSYGGAMADLRRAHLAREFQQEIEVLDLADLANIKRVADLAAGSRAVIHLAAWPGVKAGETRRAEYARANLAGFANVLEAVKLSKPEKFLFASSSSIYGELGQAGPVREFDADGTNLKSFYASTKWSNEISGREFQSATEIPTLALRFFTVYGEFGRPDMAYWIFLEKLLRDEPITLFSSTGGTRAFTYVLDACERVFKLLEGETSGFEAFNVAAGEPVSTFEMLKVLAQTVGRKPEINIAKREDFDVSATWADLTKLNSVASGSRVTDLTTGLQAFSNWYLSYRERVN